MFSQRDKDMLKTLAKKQLEIANSPVNLERINLWKKHNNFNGERPMVHIEVDTFAKEIIMPRLQCENPIARQIEYSLYHNFTNMELLNDDKVVPPYFPVKWQTDFRLFGYKIEKTMSIDTKGNSVGHSFNHVISDLQNDFHLLHKTEYEVNKTGTKEYASFAEDVIGVILPVKMTMDCLYAVPTQKIVHLMGMEQMYLAMYDCPDLFMQIMNRTADDYISYFKMLEQEDCLLPTTGFESLGQGSFCFSDELPDHGKLTTNDVWGFMDSQETVGISPEMFAEFILPCYLRIAETFGLLSYGCCEPVSPIWQYIKDIPNLRKVSISPWCSEEFMGEALRGKRIVFHRKPSPNFLGVNTALDENAVTAHIKKTLKAAAGCTLEITQRDVYTIHNDLNKACRYVKLIRECIDQYW